ncbi:uncharacterized protein VTP21DRAFT_9572 [Calcarisporiella thermophila]|uniref:uncharacterized protein n=1 Tax=Calcarisporiella thermophila TaxID=911321 RepID=UPI003743A799
MLLRTRRSDKDLRRRQDAQPISVSKPTIDTKNLAIIPPIKAIRALCDYQATLPGELSFSKGDFFHLIDDNLGNWYEVSNPLTKVRGMVPAHNFEVLEKGRQGTRGENMKTGAGGSSVLVATLPEPNVFQALVLAFSLFLSKQKLYDFSAEREDELEVKAGERILVLANANPQWLVARPSDRPGNPGLIPLSFVQILSHPSQSNPPAAAPAPKPTLEIHSTEPPLTPVSPTHPHSPIKPFGDFSRKMSEHSVGGGGGGGGDRGGGGEGNGERLFVRKEKVSITSSSSNISILSPPPEEEEQLEFPLAVATVIDARAEAYWFEGEMFMCRVRTTFSDGTSQLITRSYDDFYSFHRQLLAHFPSEAGRTKGQKRTLPFLPGAVQKADGEVVVAELCDALTLYLRELFRLPGHILGHPLVERLLPPRGLQLPNGGQGERRPSDYAMMGHSAPTEHLYTRSASVPTIPAIPTKKQPAFTPSAQKMHPPPPPPPPPSSQPKQEPPSLQRHSHQRTQLRRPRATISGMAAGHEHGKPTTERGAPSQAGLLRKVASAPRLRNPKQVSSTAIPSAMPLGKAPAPLTERVHPQPNKSPNMGASKLPMPKRANSRPPQLDTPAKPLPVHASIPTTPTSTSFSFPHQSQSRSHDYIKVKAHLDDEIIAVRMPLSLTFADLQAKLADRLEGWSRIEWHDPQSGRVVSVRGDGRLREILDVCGWKLVVHLH